MEQIYLFCLIVGGIVLLASLFGGQHHFGGHDIDVSNDFHHDVDTVGEHAFTGILGFFNIRNIVFFLTFFGASGTFFSWRGKHGFISVLLSVIAGILSMAIAHYTFKLLQKGESGDLVQQSEFAGKLAVVAVDCSADQKGKIELSYAGQFHQCIALTDETAGAAVLRQGTPVVVVRIENGVAYIVPDETRERLQ